MNKRQNDYILFIQDILKEVYEFLNKQEETKELKELKEKILEAFNS
jgi:hypothetical protein